MSIRLLFDYEREIYMKRILFLAGVAVFVGALMGAASGRDRGLDPDDFGVLLDDGAGGQVGICAPNAQVEVYSEIHDHYDRPREAAQALLRSIRDAADPNNPELDELAEDERVAIQNWLREGFKPALSLGLGREITTDSGSSLFVRMNRNHGDVYISVASEGEHYFVEHAAICADSIRDPEHWRHAPTEIREQFEAEQEVN